VKPAPDGMAPDVMQVQDVIAVQDATAEPDGCSEPAQLRGSG
jgi:hypothetical protein